MEGKIQPTMYFVLQQNALLYRLIAKKQHTRVVGVPNMELQENPLKGTRDTAYQVICF